MNLPTSAHVTVIGAGIAGNSVVGHLAEMGWRNIVQIDKGPLPNPGGSTGHASNFCFPVDHSKEMTLLTLDSTRQYDEMGVMVVSGGIEVARTTERMEELRRRMTSARAWGVESYLISPEEVLELVPFINGDIILGGFYSPGVTVVDSLRAGTIMREKAQALDALTVLPNTEVLSMEVRNGAIAAVVTDRGRIETEHLVIACGVWSPRMAAMAGATIPLTPAVHQMIDVGPIPVLQATNSEIGYPIVRDMDTFMYERQTAGSMEVGSYAHRPIFHHPDDIPSLGESLLSPTELPFTDEDFDLQMEHALELMPEILSAAEIRYAINGLLSLTPDAMPLLGETVEVKNLWSAAAVWIKEGPGVGKMVAQWMTQGYPEIDPHSSDIARFYRFARTEHHILSRCEEHFNKTYGIVHPREQWESNRRIRTVPAYPRQVELGAVFYEVGGWERPQWYEVNAPLVEKYGVAGRDHEWDARWWSPIINAEHLAMRENVGMVDLTAFAIFDVTGPGAVDYIQKMAVNQCDVAVGRAVYTPLLTETGGFRADLTILRLGKHHYRVISGGGRRRPGPLLVPQEPARRRIGDVRRQHLGGLHGGPVGAQRPKGDRRPHRRRRLPLRIPVRIGERGQPVGDRRPDVPDLLCRRVGLGDFGAHGTGAAAVGHVVGGRPAVGSRPSGNRGVWHHGTPGEGVPPDGRRTGVGVQPRGGRTGPAQGEEGRLHRQGPLPESAPGGPGHRALHPHRGGPHLGVGHRAVHGRQRADRHPRRGADRGQPRAALLCDHRRERAVGGQVPAARLPAARARGGRQGPGSDLHGRDVSGEGGGGGKHSALRPDQRADEVLR